MAVLKKNVIGILSGKLDDKIYRERNGKCVVYSLPGPYKQENQGKCIVPRKTFGLAVRFTVFLNKIPLLKKIWKIADIKGPSVYHKLIIHNTGKNNADRLTTKNIISPPGLSLIINDTFLTAEGITSALEIIDGTLLAPLQAFIVIYFYNRENENPKDFQVLAFSQEVTDSVDGRKFNITIASSPVSLDAMSSYQNCIIYYALVKDESTIDRLTWTSTAAVEISL